MKDNTKKILLIIDANSLIHRAYHALPPLSTSRGELVNALHGFISILTKVVRDVDPDYLTAAFDAPGPTERKKRYSNYKAQREKAPEDLYSQIDLVKEALRAFGVQYYEMSGHEADDIIGTIAKRSSEDVRVVILTGDLDALQLVTDRVSVYYAQGIQKAQMYDEAATRERLGGLSPSMVPEIKGLAGDTSDNIPGVRGIGEKTALRLLSEHGSLQGIYGSVDDMKGSVSKKLIDNKEEAFLSKELATINCDLPLSFSFDDMVWDPDLDKVKDLLRKYELRSLEVRIDGTNKSPNEESPDKKIERLFNEGVLNKRLREIETKLAPAIRRMEKTGILIDRKHFEDMQATMDQEISSLEKKIYELAGKEFNLNSPQQLSGVLFEDLGLSSDDLKKTPKGAVSTASDELEKLRSAHPIVNEALKYRELSKLYNTYIVPLPKLADEHNRIHTHFDQLGTATGRISSSEPNMQNIPAQGPWAVRIRDGFVAEKGWTFLACDYSQVELRIAAHVAKESKLQEAFLNGEDIHTRTAAEVFKTPPSQVSKDQRSKAKALNFGILYGMGAWGFAVSAGIDPKEAEEFIKEYFERFPKIRSYIEETKEFARENGYVETVWGRKRYIPDISSRNQRVKAAAERAAINHPIQGSSADFMKQAMVDIYESYGEKDDIRMILQIHDELLFEVKEGRDEFYGPRVQEMMEGAVDLMVPLKVESKVADRWGKLFESKVLLQEPLDDIVD